VFLNFDQLTLTSISDSTSALIDGTFYYLAGNDIAFKPTSAIIPFPPFSPPPPMVPPITMPTKSAWYKMEDNAASPKVIDSSSNAYNGTASSDTAVLHTSSGKINSGFIFSGQSITIPKSIDLTSAFSVCVWIKREEGDYYRRIFNQGGSSLYIDQISRKPVFYIDGAGVNLTGASAINAAVWTHLVFTFDNDGNWLFYINGVSYGSFTPARFPASSDSFILSKNTDYPFTGTMDDFRIYQTVLTQEGVNAIYNNGNGTSL
jgi:hypothetical protein